MSELAIRRFDPGDGQAVRTLNEEAMSRTPAWVPDAPDDDLRDVESHYLEAGREFLVGVEDGEIVAMGAYEPLAGWMAERFSTGEAPPEPTVELSRMRVDPACWGRGFGTRVYEALESRARDAGYRALVLNTGADNDRARGLYESLGFEPVSETTVEFEDVSLDLALYRRAFG
jgi:ribosomal protein S18 acetylase RimI-like enzyme